MADNDGSPPSRPHRADSGFREHPVSKGCPREGVSPITVARPHRIFTGFPFVSRIPQVAADVLRRTTEAQVTNRCWLKYSVVNTGNIARWAVVVNQTSLATRSVAIRWDRTLNIYLKCRPAVCLWPGCPLWRVSTGKPRSGSADTQTLLALWRRPARGRAIRPFVGTIRQTFTPPCASRAASPPPSGRQYNLDTGSSTS